MRRSPSCSTTINFFFKNVARVGFLLEFKFTPFFLVLWAIFCVMHALFDYDMIKYRWDRDASDKGVKIFNIRYLSNVQEPPALKNYHFFSNRIK